MEWMQSGESGIACGERSLGGDQGGCFDEANFRCWRRLSSAEGASGRTVSGRRRGKVGGGSGGHERWETSWREIPLFISELVPATQGLRGLCGLAVFIPTAGEHLVEVVLGPPDVGVQAGELPHAVDLLVPVGVVGVGVALDGDGGHGGVGVLLVGDAQLVVADDLVVRHLLPLGAADEVLRLQRRVAQHVRVRGHLHKLLGRHRLPDLVEEGAVVDAQRRRDALAQARPVFRVVAVRPFEDGGHAALHLWGRGSVVLGGKGGGCCGWNCGALNCGEGDQLTLQGDELDGFENHVENRCLGRN
nr:hypothetical protein CFP56_07826 [Quercus suber]